MILRVEDWEVVKPSFSSVLFNPLSTYITTIKGELFCKNQKKSLKSHIFNTLKHTILQATPPKGCRGYRADRPRIAHCDPKNFFSQFFSPYAQSLNIQQIISTIFIVLCISSVRFNPQYAPK